MYIHATVMYLQKFNARQSSRMQLNALRHWVMGKFATSKIIIVLLRQQVPQSLNPPLVCITDEYILYIALFPGPRARFTVA